MRFKSHSASGTMRQALISFSLSLSVHLGLGLVLALTFIRSQEDSPSVIVASLASLDASNEIHEIEFTATPQPQLPDVPEQPAPDVTIELPVNTTTESSASAVLFGSTRDMHGRDMHGSIISQVAIASLTTGTSEPTPVRSKSKATFFGAEAYGNRFVFVIDSSGSMRGHRWEALCKELIRALQSLSPDQMFFIISFDSTAHPMCGLVPNNGAFMTPTPINLTRILNWLVSIENRGSTLPSTAVGIGLRLEPDAIFLLSDGEIADRTVHDLRVWNHVKENDGTAKTLIPIHTILLHSQIGFATLQTIANENSGTFTPVRPF
jgi:hypothetical protein